MILFAIFHQNEWIINYLIFMWYINKIQYYINKMYWNISSKDSWMTWKMSELMKSCDTIYLIHIFVLCILQYNLYFGKNWLKYDDF